MSDDLKTEESSGGIHFTPPLYTQRYVLAVRTLVEHNISSVVDFGCSECGFMKILPTACCVEKVALVDIDRELLVSKKRQIYPEVHHYLQRRENPLHISLFHGSAGDMDDRIKGFEAVTLIEVIEHLYPDILAKVEENVFGRLRPNLVFVTTPNSEFNVLFENPDPSQFRHWDHKFEWTRLEFKTWCSMICTKYNYNVSYSGVGEMTSTPESRGLGPCSQAAVFTANHMPHESGGGGDGMCDNIRNNACDSAEVSDGLYELIAEVDFPYVRDKLTEEQMLDHEVAFCVRNIVQSRDSDLEYGEKHLISVAQVAQHRSVQALADTAGVRKSLERQQYTLTPNRENILVADGDSSSEDEDRDAGYYYNQSKPPLLIDRLKDDGADCLVACCCGRCKCFTDHTRSPRLTNSGDCPKCCDPGSGDCPKCCSTKFCIQDVKLIPEDEENWDDAVS